MSDSPDFSILLCMIFGVVVMLGMVALASRPSKRRFAWKKDPTLLFETRCGGQLGWVAYKGDYLKLRMYEDFLVIACFQHILIRYDDIDEIVSFSSFFGRRISIKHHNANAPRRIELSADPKKVMGIFEKYAKSAM